MQDLLDYKWKFEDFPDEPMPEDFTVSNAVERVVSFCAQNGGYFSKWAMPEDFAEIYINNLTYRLREYNAELNRIFGLHNFMGHLGILKSLGVDWHTTSSTNFSYAKYLKYKILFKITFGQKKKHYRKK